MSDPEDLYDAIYDEVSRVLVGQEELVRYLTVSLLTEGHILLEGVPGVAKTTLANVFARASGLEYTRIQMTPDTLPADITGTTVYRQPTGEFELQRGPVFSNIVVADEINRATPKTQSALLEAMEERHVSIEGDTLELPDPFMVIATQNPLEMDGSLHPDESVYVNGSLRRASDLLSEARADGQRLHETGDTIVYDVGATTQTLDETGQLRETDALVYETQFDGDVYTITTGTGREITVSGNHPFLLLRNGRPEWVKARDITETDYLVTPETLTLPATPFASHETVVETLASERRCVEAAADSDIRARLNRGDPLSDAEAGFFIGSILSHGTHSDTQVSLALDDQPAQAGRWITLAERLGATVHRLTGEGGRRVSIDSAVLVAYLRERYHLDEPRRLLTAPDEFRKVLLETVLLSEAQYDREQPQIELSQQDRETTNLVVHLLLQYGMRPRIHNGDAGYHVRIQDDGVEQYCDLFEWPGTPPESPSETTRQTLPLPAEHVETLRSGLNYPLDDNATRREWTTRDGYCADGGSTSMRDPDGSPAPPDAQRRPNIEGVLKHVERLRAADVCYEPIADIERDAYDGPVVGLSVPKTHNYLAGLGACGINHNTFELPEAQRDRFQLKLTVELPNRDDERTIIDRFDDVPSLGPATVEQVVETDQFLEAREYVTSVHVSEDVREYILDLVAATRTHADVEHGASPRASLAFLHTSKARAALQGRDYVIPDDIKALAHPILVHRMVLTTDARLGDFEPWDVVDDVLNSVTPPSGKQATGEEVSADGNG